MEVVWCKSLYAISPCSATSLTGVPSEAVTDAFPGVPELVRKRLILPMSAIQDEWLVGLENAGTSIAYSFAPLLRVLRKP